MNILAAHNYYRNRGGEDRCADTLRQTLIANGHHVIPFDCDSRDIDRFSLSQKLAIPLRFRRSRDIETRLARLLEKEKPHVAIIHNLFPLLGLSILNVLKAHHIPVIKRIENYRFLCLNGLFLRRGYGVCRVCRHGNLLPGVIHRCYQDSWLNSFAMALPLMFTNWKKTLFQSVDRFWAPSRFVRDMYVEARFPAERMVVSPNFLDFEPLAELPPTSGLYAVYIGRLSPEKGVMTLLAAMEGLPGLSLKIIGEGPQAAELQAYVQEKNLHGVEFVGFLDGARKREMLQQARFLVFPSQCYESFGLTIIEGYACGLPVVASALGGAAELVREGETGFTFKPGDSLDLREKMSLLTRSPELLARMRVNALTFARERFTIADGYRELMRLLESLAPAPE